MVTDIYTGVNYVQIPVPDAWAQSPEADLIHGAYASQEAAFKFRDKTCALTTAGIQNHRGLQTHRLEPLQQRTLNFPGNKVVPGLPVHPALELPANGLGI